VPDLTILLDHPVEHGLAKARALAKAKEAHAAGDRIEREDLSFHYKVRKGYLAIARTNPRRVKLVKVHPTIEATQQEIIVLVEHLLKRKRFTTR
jgi:dTMP kinase